MQKKILISIPAYNCGKHLVKVIKELKDSGTDKLVDKIIIIDNRSTDNTEKLALDIIRVMGDSKYLLLKNNENYGLGGSHKVAFEYGVQNGFDYVTILHGDNQADVNDLKRILSSKEYSDFDCIFGSRFIKGSLLINYSRFRIFGNHIFNLIFSLATFRKIHDMGSGLNLYSTKILRNKFYFKFSDDLTFNSYMLLGTIFNKFPYKFVPISWREDDQVSNVKMTSQALNMLILLLKYVVNRKKFIASEHRAIKRSEYNFSLLE